VLATIEEAINEVRAGRMIIVIDDPGRENEGDLVMAAEAVDAEAVNFMAVHGRGLICLPVVGERLDELDLPLMVAEGTCPLQTGFAVSIDLRSGGSGISAADRAATIRHVVDAGARADDFRRPGHVFPLRARPGGVLRRAGHTEAAVDLARLAGFSPAGVICEILNPDGTMARLPQLLDFAARHGLKVVTIADLIEYRRRNEKLVERRAEAQIPTPFGMFRAVGYESTDNRQHIALVLGEIGDGDDVLVRVHSECLTGDVLHSLRCDCGKQLELALAHIGRAGRGVVVYVRGHEGRGIGLLQKLRAYELQERGFDTFEANVELGLPPDPRDYGIGAQILAELGVRTMHLLSNNPTKRAGLEGYGLRVVERVPLESEPTEHNLVYLQTKAARFGHELSVAAF
jgi:3,4-dihydroxy 2-butanone 4-phosphate synthase/GTP cyclohydrolase II